MNVPPPRGHFLLGSGIHPAVHRIAAGLMVGALICGCSLVTPATSSTPDNLGLSPTLAQAKTSSLAKNGMVTISAADYCERVNDAFDAIGATDYKATLTKGTNGITLDMDIRKGRQLVGYVEFCLDNRGSSWLTYRERSSNKTFNNMLLTIFDDGDNDAEYFVYSAIAMSMATDPSLDKWDAQIIISRLIDKAELQDDGTFYSGGKNNDIIYGFLMSNGTSYLLIGCSNA